MAQQITTEEQKTSIGKDIHQEVTDTIIRQLSNGIVPWRKPWIDGRLFDLKPAINGVTKNYYRGINTILLWAAAIEKQYASAEWASYKQWGGKGEYIRKGEKGNLVVYADVFEKEVDGEIKKIPFLKKSVVFNRCQLVNYEPPATASEPEKPLFERIETIEKFVSNASATITHGGNEAAYNYIIDAISMPHAEMFVGNEDCTAAESYYAVLLHELTHWTGHHSRLDRKIKNKFGDHAYAEEELVAELGAAFMCAEFEIGRPGLTNHAAYVANWLTVLQDNKQFIFSAAREANKAIDFLKVFQPENP